MKGTFVAIALSVFALTILVEAAWAWKKKKHVYNAKETASNFFIFAGIHAVRPIAFAYKMAIFAWVSQFRIWTIPNNVWTILLAVIFIDFLYYWMHRSYHEIPLLWTIHNVHHSSPWMNLTTSFRLNWLGFLVAPIYFLPAILIGFSVKAVLIFFLLNLVFQFFLHTESIGKIPYLEGWINTPSSHRAHHGTNPIYIDKNHGGILMIWDRMFGTYQEEVEEVKYGITTGFLGHNPFKVIFGPLIQYIRGEFVREKANIEKQQASTTPDSSVIQPKLEPAKVSKTKSQVGSSAALPQALSS